MMSDMAKYQRMVNVVTDKCVLAAFLFPLWRKFDPIFQTENTFWQYWLIGINRCESKAKVASNTDVQVRWAHIQEILIMGSSALKEQTLSLSKQLIATQFLQLKYFPLSNTNIFGALNWKGDLISWKATFFFLNIVLKISFSYHRLINAHYWRFEVFVLA